MKALLRLFLPGPRKPLSHRQPERPAQNTELGFEATDLEALNKVNRRNDALERVVTFSDKGINAATHVAPISDDETYAKTYHRLFGPKDKRK